MEKQKSSQYFQQGENYSLIGQCSTLNILADEVLLKSELVIDSGGDSIAGLVLHILEKKTNADLFIFFP